MSTMMLKGTARIKAPVKGTTMKKLTLVTPICEPTRQVILEQDRLNDELGKRFVRALAVEKAALDIRLSPACIRVLAAISYFMNASTQRAWPGYQQIHEITGHDVDTIERAIKRLKEAGYIFTERRSPITGGRALVHYGLMAVHPSHIDQIITMAVMDLRRRLTQAKIAGPEKNTKQIKAPEAKLTPAKIAGSAHTKTKADGSEKKDHIVNGLQSDPGENSGVRLTPAEAAGSHSDPGIFVPSDPGILPGSNTLSKNTLKEEEEVEAGRLVTAHPSAAV